MDSARTRKSAILLVLMIALLLSAVGVTGCTDENSPSVIKEDTANWYQQKYQETVKGAKIAEVSDGMSESHRMMANMIMLRNGIDPETATGEIYLVTLTKEDGREVAVVVKDGETLE